MNNEENEAGDSAGHTDITQVLDFGLDSCIQFDQLKMKSKKVTALTVDAVECNESEDLIKLLANQRVETEKDRLSRKDLICQLFKAENEGKCSDIVFIHDEAKANEGESALVETCIHKIPEVMGSDRNKTTTEQHNNDKTNDVFYLFGPNLRSKLNASETGIESMLRTSAYNGMLDLHRTPSVCDIDYTDASLREEIQFLKQESGMAAAAVSLQTQYSSVDNICLSVCPVCKSESTLSCKNCLQAYCSKEHQKLHWKEHRNHCNFVEIGVHNFLGRHLIAKQNMKPGDLILTELPLILGPTVGDSCLENFDFDVSEVLEPSEIQTVVPGKANLTQMLQAFPDVLASVCLGCSLELGNIMHCFCDSCGFPICSQQCPEIHNHKLECDFFQEQKITFWDCYRQYLLPPRVYIVLRFLLIKTTNPDRFNDLINLESHFSDRRDLERTCGRRMNDLYIAFVMKKAFKFTEVTLGEIQIILGIIDTNGFYMAKLVNGTLRKHVSVYQKASFLSHSCVPNAIVMLRDPASIEVVATMRIKKGDIIFVDYDYQGFLRPKYERRHLLRLQYFFVCSCPLCRDPTDFNQFLSAICCLRCRLRKTKGFLLPVDPLSDAPTWKCTKCSASKSDAGNCQVIADVSKKMFDCKQAGYKETLEEASDVTLHKNHSLILHFEHDILRIIYSNMSENYHGLNKEDIQFLYYLLDKRTEIVKELVPACHKALINLKLQQVEVMVVQAIRVEASQEAVQEIANKIEAIHDEIVGLLSENCLQNSLHAFLLLCARLVREKLKRVNEVLRHKYYVQKFGALKKSN